MDTDQVQGNVAAEEVKQPEPMPSSEQTPAEDKIAPQEVAPQAQDDLTLPEEASERTKQQFDKLKQRLAAAEAKAKPPQEYGESVYDTFRSPAQPVQVEAKGLDNLTPQQTENIVQKFVDANGNVDVEGLNRALVEANRAAAQAVQEARMSRQELARFEETQQVRELHAKHPEVDPKSKEFDPELFKLLKDRILREKFFEGKQVDPVAIVRELKSTYKAADVAKAKQDAVDEYKQTQERRTQGPVEVGKGESRSTIDNLQELRQKSRTERISGNTPSIDARLRSLGIIK